MVIRLLVVPDVDAAAQPVSLGVQQQGVNHPLLQAPPRRHRRRDCQVSGGVQRGAGAPGEQAGYAQQDEQGGGAGEEGGQRLAQGSRHLQQAGQVNAAADGSGRRQQA